ncbi:hypothetical protein [Cyclobacterium plantarum]|uniref:Outer membrane protein beta-barrel domain-containing protein n=1 Tax=Cyclobacterium plantarum TaxID=2716263 RepID=A0ABX0HBH0_9BACT|nr:hypothetical protein [Cyclobacterium plantarum]NHE59250.1 hypothetical protein [Cyclobacterium plantarum]
MLLILSANAIAAQCLDIRLGLGSFSLNRDYGYERPAVGWYVSLGLTYDYTPEWTMGTVFNRSYNVYFRESMAETPLLIGNLPTRAEVNSDHFSFIFSRNIILPFGLKGQIGLGMGLAIDENRFYHPILFDEEQAAYRGVNLVEQYEVGIIFPGQFAVRKALGIRWHLGLQAGVFLDQQFRMRGSYWGPELGYRF